MGTTKFDESLMYRHYGIPFVKMVDTDQGTEMCTFNPYAGGADN